MKTLLFSMLFSCTLPLYGQDKDVEAIERNPRAQEKIRAARIAFITDRLELSPEEAEKFWPVYREYTEKRKEIRQQLRESRRSGRDEKEIIDLELDLKQQELDLEKDYAQRLQRVISAEKVVALRQAERDFTRLLLEQIRKRREQAERIQRHRDRTERDLHQRGN